ncbi:MAG TPA: HigA family addiction module antitoxin [Nitrosomonas nitrosa]|nr:HigA family addiction module antitoxin [Nitrosomonas nitrosa]
MSIPQHPGKILKEHVLKELNLSVTEASDQLGVSRVALSRILNGKAEITTAMAIRLEAWLEDITAEYWLHQQAEYNLWQKRKNITPDIKPVRDRLLTTKILHKLLDEGGRLKFGYPLYDRTENILVSEITKKIKEARVKMNGHTIDTASKLLKISSKELKYYEKSNFIKYLPLTLIKRAAEAYDVSMDWLFGIAGDEFEMEQEVRSNRKNLFVEEVLNIEYSKASEKHFTRIQNELLTIVKSVTSMIDAYKEIDEAFIRFQKTNE